MKPLFLTIILFFTINLYSQTEIEVERNFTKIKTIITAENNLTKLKGKLDSLKLTSKDQRNNRIESLLNRSIDFDYNHNRIIVRLDSWNYQLDLVSKNDSIYLTSLKTNHFKEYTFQFLSEKEMKIYLKKRNSFYHSYKNLKDLFREIPLEETFAMQCGDGLPYTKEGLEIKSLVKEEYVETLQEMLSNLNCEKQAFAVLGFQLLSKNGIVIPKESAEIIQHIKSRNSELLTCSGCINGVVKKIY